MEFVDLRDPTSFEMADGVIIPQGIFEEIEPQNLDIRSKTDVRVQKCWMLEQENSFRLPHRG
jgi:hypothetical protein